MCLHGSTAGFLERLGLRLHARGAGRHHGALRPRSGQVERLEIAVEDATWWKVRKSFEEDFEEDFWWTQLDLSGFGGFKWIWFWMGFGHLLLPRIQSVGGMLELEAFELVLFWAICTYRFGIIFEHLYWWFLVIAYLDLSLAGCFFGFCISWFLSRLPHVFPFIFPSWCDTWKL